MIRAKKMLWFLKTSTESQSGNHLKRARLYTWAVFQGTIKTMDCYADVLLVGQPPKPILIRLRNPNYEKYHITHYFT